MSINQSVLQKQIFWAGHGKIKMLEEDRCALSEDSWLSCSCPTYMLEVLQFQRNGQQIHVYKWQAAWFMNGCIRLFKDHLHLKLLCFIIPQINFSWKTAAVFLLSLSLLLVSTNPHWSPYRKKDIYIFNVKNYIKNAENNNNLHLKSSTIDLEFKQQLYNNCAP